MIKSFPFLETETCHVCDNNDGGSGGTSRGKKLRGVFIYFFSRRHSVLAHEGCESEGYEEVEKED
jgi:hypothetical protein